MSDILETKLIGLENDLRTIKTSQPTGQSNYRIYNHASVEVDGKMFKELGFWAGYWVYFKGTAQLPLVQFAFEVYENGVRVTPKDYTGKMPGANSSGQYCYTFNCGYFFDWGLALPTKFDYYAPETVAVFLQGAYTPDNVRIVAKCRSTCTGIFGIEEGRSRI